MYIYIVHIADSDSGDYAVYVSPCFSQVQLLVQHGLSLDEICVLAYYYAQLQRIRNHLRRKRFGKVIVCHVVLDAYKYPCVYVHCTPVNVYVCCS